MAPASRAAVVRLLSLTSNGGCRGCGRTHGAHHHHPPTPALSAHGHSHTSMLAGARGMATPVDGTGYNPPPGNTDYAFEVSNQMKLNYTCPPPLWLLYGTKNVADNLVCRWLRLIFDSDRALLEK